MLNEPGSCFVDSCELALGVPATAIATYIKHHFPESQCPTLGYHPTFVNIACLELFKIGVSQVDPRPVGYGPDGDEIDRDDQGLVVAHVGKWFQRRGFRCVITGPLLTGSGDEHANAWNGQCWLDPANPTVPLDAPSINIRSLWVLTVPPEAHTNDQA